MHNSVAKDQHCLFVPEPPREHVAIVGMAVNMPGASSTSKLWEVLEKGLNMVSEVKIASLDLCGSADKTVFHIVIGSCEPLSGQ